MKLKKFLAAVAVITGIFACTCAVSAATEVKVSVPQFNVVVNGRFVENDYRQYPFIVYNDITYFPMTYNDCAFLGLQNQWSYATGTVLTAPVASSGVYDDIITPVLNDTSDETAIITEGPITVNGASIVNAWQAYPILTFRNVPYFPLTWDWCQAFGWNINFDQTNGLSVASAGYENNGYINYYYSYRNSYSGYIKSCHISEVEDHALDRSGSYSYSPNHYRRSTYDDDFVEMYSLYDLSYLCVHSSAVDAYRQAGWYTYDQIETMFLEAFKNNSLLNVEYQVNEVVLETSPYSVPGKERMKELLPYYRENYISVFNYNLTAKMTIPKYQIEEYRAVGWQTYDQFVINLANSFASQGQYAKAVAALSFGDQNFYPVLTHNYTIPLEYHDKFYDTTYSQAKRIYADSVLAKGCPIAVVNTAVKTNDYGTLQAVLVLANVSYKDIDSVRLRFTCYDSKGRPTDDYTYSDYSVITVDDTVDLKSPFANAYTVNLYSNKKTSYIGNIVVESVVYEDGTKWSR